MILVVLIKLFFVYVLRNNSWGKPIIAETIIVSKIGIVEIEIKKGSQFLETPSIIGGPTRARTWDFLIMSQIL